MTDPNTPQEHTPDYLRARENMKTDVHELVEILLKGVNIRAGHYEPAENRHFSDAEQFLLDLVIEKLQERR
jgi:hypothetical protein